MMGRHPISDEQIIAFAAGELDDVQASAVAAHLAGCADCTATVARYRGVRSTLRTDTGVEPPPSTVARAQRIFRVPQPATATDPFAALRRVLARLRFDSRPGLELALGGVRGATRGYQLGFEAETAVVDLQLEPPAADHADRWRLLGQIDVVPDEDGEAGAVGRIAVALRNIEATFDAEADEHGAFSLLAPAGRYDLLVGLPNQVVVLPDVEIG